MSAMVLPPGTDVLESYRHQMTVHAFGQYQSLPESDFQLLGSLVSRTLALAPAVAALDGKPTDEFEPLARVDETIRGHPMPVDPHRRPELHLGSDWTWRALGDLVAGMLAIEDRLRALDRLWPTRDDRGMFTAIVGQVKCDGFVHKVEGRFYEATKVLVYRVLEAESRKASLAQSKGAAKS